MSTGSLQHASQTMAGPMQLEDLLWAAVAHKTDQEIFTLESLPEFTSAETLREQIHIVHRLFTVEQKRLSLQDIGDFFGRHKTTIKEHLQKSYTVPASPGRHSVLTHEEMEEIVTFINTRYAEHNPTTYDDILDLCLYLFHKTVLPDTLRHALCRHQSVRTVTGVPMERERVEVDPADIDTFYDELATLLQGIPGAFIFNIDESGVQEWTDAHHIRVLVPAEYTNDTIPLPKSRGSKRSTLVAGIAGDGTTLTPMVLISRTTIENEIALYGYNHGANVIFKYQPHAFMTTILFEQWAREVFFPEVTQRRLNLGYEGEALLIMDGLGAHHSETFLSECREHNIKVKFLVPHSSDQTQPLDLVTFGILKRSLNRSAINAAITIQANQVIKMMGAWYQATPPHLVIRAFNAMGLKQAFNFQMRQLTYSVDRAMATRVRELVNSAPTPRTERMTRENIRT